MKALVTCFDPFGGDELNAAREAVRLLPPRIGRLEIVTAELPTSYARSLAVLEHAIARVMPGIVLCVGQASERSRLCVERVAVNVQDARFADNDGARPLGTPVVRGGPPAYFATLPVEAAIAALTAAGLPAEVSMSAGTFVCNHVFYGLMHLAATGAHRFRGGFLHVPRLPHQAQSEDGASPMATEDIARGIGIVLLAAANAQMEPQINAVTTCVSRI